MSVRVGCPYCNHKVTLPEVPAGRATVCGCCGELFPVTGPLEEVADRPEAPPRPPADRPGFLWLAPLLLLVTGALVGGGAVVWVIRGFNRPAPPPVATAPSPAGPVTWPPAAVPLLAHLPRDVGVAFAVQPGPLLAHAERTGDDPRKLLADLGVPERVFATLADVGLPLESIDQLAGGLALPADSAIPRLVVAVKPKPPATVAGVLDKLKATRAGEAYKAVVGALPVALADRGGVLVAATADADLTAGGGPLPAGLREALAQLSPSAFAWVATDAADWADKPAIKAAALLLKRPDLSDRLKLARSAAVGLSLEPGLTAKAAVRAAGDEAGLRDKLAAAAAGRDVLVGGGDGWVTLTAKPAELPRP